MRYTNIRDGKEIDGNIAAGFEKRKNIFFPARKQKK